jgi:uncharacterized repeat protein (TIGR03803 family)
MTTTHIQEGFTFSTTPARKRENMNQLSRWKTACAIFLLCAATAIGAPAQTLTTLATFNGSNGTNPAGALAQGLDGNFYGTTIGGSVQVPFLCGYGTIPGCGTVLKVTPAGTLTTLHSFCSEPNCADGGNALGGVTLATDGNFYGGTARTEYEPLGTIFKITPAGKLSTVYSPGESIGWYPNALVQATDGNFYGTTLGQYGDHGSIFEITPGGTLTTLYNFCPISEVPYCPDGADATPNALVQGTDGNFYGTAPLGGNGGNPACSFPDPAYGCGTVFKITPGGTLTTLYRFCANWPCNDGEEPAAGLVQGTDGNFYGTTRNGGYLWAQCSSNKFVYLGCGTVFKITPGGKLTTLYGSFCYPQCGTNGGSPMGGLIQATDGNFYGTTTIGGANGGGTVFKITPQGTLTTLYSFCAQTNCSDGAQPSSTLVQGTDGDLYGTTSAGGDATCNCGTAFRLTTGLSPFVRFIRDSRKVGQTVQILGQGFTGTTIVSFSGTPAAFTVKSDTYLTVTVPAGATTGLVTVATPSGTLSSNRIFRVTPRILSFSPTSGPAGTSVVITGESFTGAKAVVFICGKAASFTVDSDTKITAIVPAGATTGKFNISNPGGAVASAAIFTVTSQ